MLRRCPHECTHRILLHAMSEFIERSKVVLSTRMPLRSGLLIPALRCRKILRDAFLEVIQHPKVILRVRVTLCCGFLEPLPRLCVIPRHTPPIVIQQPEVGLRFRDTLGCLFRRSAADMSIGGEADACSEGRTSVARRIMTRTRMVAQYGGWRLESVKASSHTRLLLSSQPTTSIMECRTASVQAVQAE